MSGSFGVNCRIFYSFLLAHLFIHLLSHFFPSFLPHTHTLTHTLSLSFILPCTEKTLQILIISLNRLYRNQQSYCHSFTWLSLLGYFIFPACKKYVPKTLSFGVKYVSGGLPGVILECRSGGIFCRETESLCRSTSKRGLSGIYPDKRPQAGKMPQAVIPVPVAVSVPVSTSTSTSVSVSVPVSGSVLSRKR